MNKTFAFDVYGTLVDPVQMGLHLEVHLGDRARAFGQLWHEKKVEYAFRRGLMERYRDFGVCTRQALDYCLRVFGVELSDDEVTELMAKFGELDAFPDVRPGLTALKQRGHKLVAFSNGPVAAVRALLGHGGVLPLLDDVISVDEVGTFKPSPRVYAHLLHRAGVAPEDCWMISGNPWDVIGGKAAGLNAAWVQRDLDKIFDPWEYQPDLVVRDLVELSQIE